MKGNEPCHPHTEEEEKKTTHVDLLRGAGTRYKKKKKEATLHHLMDGN